MMIFGRLLVWLVVASSYAQTLSSAIERSKTVALASIGLGDEVGTVHERNIERNTALEEMDHSFSPELKPLLGTTESVHLEEFSKKSFKVKEPATLEGNNIPKEPTKTRNTDVISVELPRRKVSAQASSNEENILVEGVVGESKSQNEDGSEIVGAKKSESGALVVEGPQKVETIRSIENVEIHLQQIKQLEGIILNDLEKLESNVEGSEDGEGNEEGRGNKQIEKYITRELYKVKNHLNRLSESLNRTIVELDTVEREDLERESKLKNVARIQKEEEEAKRVEEQGAKAVDYETGRLKNMSGFSVEQLTKLKSMEQESDPAILHYDFDLLGEIAILFGISAVGGIIAVYFNLPSTLGYITGGMAVGPSGMGIVSLYKEVETLSLFGSIFLLFAHGAEYSLENTGNIQRRFVVLGVIYVVCIVSILAFGSYSFGWCKSLKEGLVFGMASCLSFTPPLFSYIHSNKLESTFFGKCIVGVVCVQDVLMSFIFCIPELASSSSVRLFSTRALMTLLSYASIVALSLLLHFKVLPSLIAFLSQIDALNESNSSQLVLLGVVSTCLSMAFLTELSGLSLESGAFFAGLAFVGVKEVGHDVYNDANLANSPSNSHAGTHEYHQRRKKYLEMVFTSIHVVENLFGNLFFACIGMLINFGYLFRNLLDIVSLFVFIVTIKTLVGFFLLIMSGNNSHKSMKGSASLCMVSEFALIFMIKAQSLGIVSRRIYLLFVAVSALFLSSSPLFQSHLRIEERRDVAGKGAKLRTRRSSNSSVHSYTTEQLQEGNHGSGGGGIFGSLKPVSHRRRHKHEPSAKDSDVNLVSEPNPGTIVFCEKDQDDVCIV